jgi:hypothetical protein
VWWDGAAQRRYLWGVGGGPAEKRTEGMRKLLSDARWEPRNDLSPVNRMEEYREYPMVTAYDLRSSTQRPKRVKMLMRDFIEGNIAATLAMRMGRKAAKG